MLEQPATIGDGTKIWHFCHVSPDTVIGKNCNIGQNVFIAGKVKVGDNVKIQNNVSIYEGVTIEDDVFCGPSCVFTNVIKPRSHISQKGKYSYTRVMKGATIGANATIICGHNIGKYAFIGAGTVVTKDVPSYALVYGNPASIQGWVCECGSKLDINGTGQVTCSKCGNSFTKRDDKGEQRIERIA
ncbi:MAG: acyltransferase [Paludibacter sp.]|nr:acyltransferase [Paludibacter sp.]